MYRLAPNAGRSYKAGKRFCIHTPLHSGRSIDNRGHSAASFETFVPGASVHEDDCGRLLVGNVPWLGRDASYTYRHLQIQR